MLVSVDTPKTTVSLDDVKDYIKATGTDDDSLIQSLISTTVEDGENFTNRQFGEATYELLLETICDGFKLPKNPIQSIEKIELLDSEGNYNVVASSKYYLYQELGIGRIKLKETLDFIDHKRAVKITFKCGYTTVPETIQTWIKYKVMCLFDGKEENINKYVDNMIAKYRIGPLG